MKAEQNSIRREPAGWRGRLGWGKTAAAEHNTMRGRSASCDVAVTVCMGKCIVVGPSSNKV